MSSEYRTLRAEADRLQHYLQDKLDDRQAGASLEAQARNVIEQCEMEKNPHTIEDSVKRMIDELRDLRRVGSGLMDYSHLDELCDGYETLRQAVHGLPNY